MRGSAVHTNRNSILSHYRVIALDYFSFFGFLSEPYLQNYWTNQIKLHTIIEHNERKCTAQEL